MPELRWILIVCGAALLLGIYLWGRRSARQAPAGEDTMLRIPEPSREAAREPRSAYVFRDGPAVDPDEAAGDDAPMADDEPIIANRRHRDHMVAEQEDAQSQISDETDEPAPAAVLNRDRDVRRVRVEPTLGEDVNIAEQSPPHIVSQPPTIKYTAADSQIAAPTLSMSSTPPLRRVERRKIIALRIAAGVQRFGGEQLLEAVQAEGLQHGKYDVFHRLDDSGASIFSVASMVEPGTFNPSQMHAETFPGITMFTQLPASCESLLAFNELVLSARRLQEKLGGNLQDDRGVPLTVHRIERLRQDIREFEQGQGRDGGREGRQRTDAVPSSTTP